MESIGLTMNDGIGSLNPSCMGLPHNNTIMKLIILLMVNILNNTKKVKRRNTN